MTNAELLNYWEPAANNIFKGYGSNVNTFNQLDELLGIKEYDTWCGSNTTTDKPLNEDLKRLLIALAGPHWKTILKIHQIQKAET
jgi:hypothetical protein